MIRNRNRNGRTKAGPKHARKAGTDMRVMTSFLAATAAVLALAAIRYAAGDQAANCILLLYLWRTLYAAAPAHKNARGGTYRGR